MYLSLAAFSATLAKQAGEKRSLYDTLHFQTFFAALCYKKEKLLLSRQKLSTIQLFLLFQVHQ